MFADHAKPADAEAAERAAFAAIGDLGRREIDSVKAWAASGCEGLSPQPDAEARRRLNDRLMAAIGAEGASP
jgi:hypothetical protein